MHYLVKGVRKVVSEATISISGFHVERDEAADGRPRGRVLWTLEGGSTVVSLPARIVNTARDDY